jgi:hypothetical protein
LKIESANATVHIQDFASQIKTGTFAALHAGQIQLNQWNAPSGDFGVRESAVANNLNWRCAQ